MCLISCKKELTPNTVIVDNKRKYDILYTDYLKESSNGNGTALYSLKCITTPERAKIEMYFFAKEDSLQPIWGTYVHYIDTLYIAGKMVCAYYNIGKYDNGHFGWVFNKNEEIKSEILTIFKTDKGVGCTFSLVTHDGINIKGMTDNVRVTTFY